MNVENIKRVRDHIARLPAERFNMSDFCFHLDAETTASLDELRHDCGTAGCIAGWAAAILSDEEDGRNADDLATEALGLSATKAGQLFFPPTSSLAWRTITIPQAVTVLDHLLATGEVDWSVAEQVAA